MLEFLFAFILTAAVVAVLFKPKQGGLAVMAIAMMVALWYLGNLMEWHPLFFVYVVFVAAAIKIIDEVLGTDMLDGELVLAIADMLLARWQGGRGGGQRPPTGGPGGGGPGGVQEQRRTETGPQRYPPGQQQPPPVFQDQDVAPYDVDAAAEDEDVDREERFGNLEAITKDRYDR